MESKEILRKKEVPLYQFEDSEEIRQVSQMEVLGSSAIYENSKDRKMVLNAYSTVDSSNEKQIQKLLVKQLTISNPEELAAIKAEINRLRTEQQYRNDVLKGLVMADRLSVSKRDLDDRKKAAKKAAKYIKNAEKYKTLFEQAKTVKDKVSYLKKRRSELMTAQEKIGAAYGNMDEFEKVQIDIAKCKENLKIREDLAKLYSECKSVKERAYVDAEINKINAENSALTASVMEITNNERQYEKSCDEEALTEKEKEKEKEKNNSCEKTRGELLIGTMRTEYGKRHDLRSLFQDVWDTNFSSLNSISRMENAVSFMLVYAKKELRLKAKFLSEKEANRYANLRNISSQGIVEAEKEETNELKKMVNFSECIRVLKGMYQRKDYVGISRIRKKLFDGAEIKFDKFTNKGEEIQKIAEFQTYTDSVVYNEGKKYWGRDYVNEIMNKKDRKESATDKELEAEEQILKERRNAIENERLQKEFEEDTVQYENLKKKADDLKKELSDPLAKQSEGYDNKVSELDNIGEEINRLFDKIQKESTILKSGVSFLDKENKLEESYLKNLGYAEVTEESLEEYNSLLTEENEKHRIESKAQYIDKVFRYEENHKADVKRGQLLLSAREEYLKALDPRNVSLLKKQAVNKNIFVPNLRHIVSKFSLKGLKEGSYDAVGVFRGILREQIDRLERELDYVHMEMKWEEDIANAGADEGYSEEEIKAAKEKLEVLEMEERAVKDGITGSRQELEKVRK